MNTDPIDQSLPMIEKKPTTFEWGLYVWFVINAILAIWALSTGSIAHVGVGWTDWVLPIVGVTAMIALLGYLLRPTWAILTLAAIYFGCQAVELHIAGRPYVLNIGLAVDFVLVRSPELLVKINLVAIVSGSLYALAAYHRFEEEGP